MDQHIDLERMADVDFAREPARVQRLDGTLRIAPPPGTGGLRTFELSAKGSSGSAPTTAALPWACG